MKNVSLGNVAALSLIGILLSGCGSNWLGGSNEVALPGERISILTRDSSLKADPRIADLDVRLPKPDPNDEWPQEGGYPNHAMYHLSAAGPLKQLWETGVGEGTNSEAQLLAQPVIADGRVYTIDIEAEVHALDAETGARVWDYGLTGDADHEGILGGGLAVDDGRIFATTGFGDVVALDAATGKEIWRKTLNGPIRAAPTVRAGRVFVITVTNELFALAASDGRELWTHSGLAEVAGLVGGAAPAVGSGIVVAPFTSGEVVALRVENGRTVWTDSLAALRRSNAVTSLAHIRGRPVIDRGIVYVVSNSRRMVAIDLRTGTRLWEVEIGGLNGPWVAGEFVFIVTRDAELVALTRRGGRVRWITQLPNFEDQEDQEDPIRWVGPILVSDRLLVIGSHEEIWSVSPYTGKVLGRIDTDGPVLISPAVARETIYMLSDDADLIALR